MIASGRATLLPTPSEFRATTVQACGLWPWSAGTSTPVIGAPLGRHLTTGATVCADPISWFQRAKLISNPSAMVLGLPGLGKTTAVRKMLLGAAAFGVIPAIFADLKPDYVDLVRALGGQVIAIGRGRGYLNILDGRAATIAAARLTGSARAQVLGDSHQRRATLVEALVSIARGSGPTAGITNVTDREANLIGRAIELLDDAHPRTPPVLGDLLTLVREAPDPLRAIVLDRGDLDRYRQLTEDLEATLMGLVGAGRLGEVFSRQTSEPMEIDRPVAFDISGIPDTDGPLRAAAQLAGWATGFGAVATANVLADAGLEPRRHYLVVLDEIHQALRVGAGMVRRMDSLTRLNRAFGVGVLYCTHTTKDLLALPTEDERLIAGGFVERAGMLLLGGLPADEMPYLSAAVRLSEAEQTLLTSWTTPPAFDARVNREGRPPGQGKFLIKVGGKPGIPFEVRLTAAERDLHNTNKLWAQQSRIGGL